MSLPNCLQHKQTITISLPTAHDDQQMPGLPIKQLRNYLSKRRIKIRNGGSCSAWRSTAGTIKAFCRVDLLLTLFSISPIPLSKLNLPSSVSPKKNRPTKQHRIEESFRSAKVSVAHKKEYSCHILRFPVEFVGDGSKNFHSHWLTSRD